MFAGAHLKVEFTQPCDRVVPDGQSREARAVK